ncbi:PREDICTED: uncharacterized protein LOC101377382 [Odobenus rosmarus divergens]|uniref:Uncharacterized protein LOC101377382 n=1 Tax=Odobenus rosmarus divergens TaxID=9708 RepID=A0A9B0GE37_ODORO
MKAVGARVPNSRGVGRSRPFTCTAASDREAIGRVPRPRPDFGPSLLPWSRYPLEEGLTSPSQFALELSSRPLPQCPAQKGTNPTQGSCSFEKQDPPPQPEQGSDSSWRLIT